MEYENIKINDLEFPRSTGQPTSFRGRRYRKSMVGINLKFSVWGAHKKKGIENLFASDGIIVQDPFAGRTYKAKCRLISSSYQNGAPQHQYHHYHVKVTEMETQPQVKVLAIQDQNFKVVRYREHNLSKRSGFSITALLQLTPEEFAQLSAFQAVESVNVQRIGTDEKSVTLSWGPVQPWSRHEAKAGQHIYQVVKFFPPGMLPREMSNRDLTVENEILKRVTLSALTRLQALLNELVANKVVAQELASKIMGDKPETLLEQSLYNRLLQEMDRVSDAKALL